MNNIQTTTINYYQSQNFTNEYTQTLSLISQFICWETWQNQTEVYHMPHTPKWSLLTGGIQQTCTCPFAHRLWKIKGDSNMSVNCSKMKWSSLVRWGWHENKNKTLTLIPTDPKTKLKASSQFIYKPWSWLSHRNILVDLFFYGFIP